MLPPLDTDDPSQSMADSTQSLVPMIMGFRVTQMLHVAAKLGIADLLKDGPQDLDSLAVTTGTDPASLYRLLRALAGYGVFAVDEQNRYVLTPLAQGLRSDVPGSQRARALHHGSPAEWQAWGNLAYSVTTGKPAFQHIHGMDPWEYRAANPEANAVFNDFMTTMSHPQTAAIVRAYDFSGLATIVDIGGGHGALLAAILAANPHLRGVLFDRPHVVAGAGPILAAAQVADRCEIVSGDFFSAVPDGKDAYMLKIVLHDWDDDGALAILKTCRRAMPAQGRLLLAEHVIPPGNAQHPSHMIDLQMLVNFGAKERTEAEFRTLLAAAGFDLTRIIATAADLSIVEGTPV